MEEKEADSNLYVFPLTSLEWKPYALKIQSLLPPCNTYRYSFQNNWKCILTVLKLLVTSSKSTEIK